MIARSPLKNSCYRRDHALDVGNHVPVRKPENGEPPPPQIVIANGIVALGQLAIMRPAIDFDEHRRMNASKVDHIASDPHLLAKVVAARAKAIEAAPKAYFHRTGRRAQCPSNA